MHHDAFDQATRMAATGATRRGVLRLLAGMAAGSRLSLLGLFDSGYGGSHHRNCCPAGTLLSTISIPTDGAVVRTPALSAGQHYRLRVSGAITTNVGTKLGVLAIDAGYLFFTRDGASALGADRLNGVDVGLAMVSGASAADRSATWGAFRATHLYERKVVGQGQPIKFRFQGAGTWPTIRGELRVEVRCA